MLEPESLPLKDSSVKSKRKGSDASSAKKKGKDKEKSSSAPEKKFVKTISQSHIASPFLNDWIEKAKVAQKSPFGESSFNQARAEKVKHNDEVIRSKKCAELSQAISRLFKKGHLNYSELLQVLERNKASPALPMIEEIVANVVRSFMIGSVPDSTPLPLLRPSYSVTGEDLLSQSPAVPAKQVKLPLFSTETAEVSIENGIKVLQHIFDEWVPKPDSSPLDLLIILRTCCVGIDYAGMNPKTSKESFKQLCNLARSGLTRIIASPEYHQVEKKLCIEAVVSSSAILLTSHNLQIADREQAENLLTESFTDNKISLAATFLVYDNDVKRFAVKTLLEDWAHFGDLNSQILPIIRVFSQGIFQTYDISSDIIIQVLTVLLEKVDLGNPIISYYALQIFFSALSVRIVNSEPILTLNRLFERFYQRQPDHFVAFIGHLVETEDVPVLINIFLNVLRKGNQDLTGIFVQEAFDSFLLRLIPFPSTLNDSFKAIQEILRRIRKQFPAKFYRPHLELVSLDSVDVILNLKKLVLLSQFFRPDELYWPERDKETSETLFKEEKERVSDKPALFMMALKSTKKASLFFFSEFLFHLRASKNKPELLPSRKNLEDFEWWIGVFISHSAKTDIKLHAGLKILLLNIIIELRTFQPDVTEKCHTWIPSVRDWILKFNEDEQREGQTDFLWLTGPLSDLTKEAAAGNNGEIGAGETLPGQVNPADNTIENLAPGHTTVMQTIFGREKDFRTIDQKFLSTALRAISGTQRLLKREYLEPVLPFLWKKIGKLTHSWVGEVAFLFLICAEIIPEATRTIVTADLHDQNASTRITALRKISDLIEYRNQSVGEERALRFSCPISEFGPVSVGTPHHQILVPTWVKKMKVSDMLNNKDEKSSGFNLLWEKNEEEQEKQRKERMAVPLTSIQASSFFDDTPLDRPKNLFPGFIEVISSPLIELLKDRHPEVNSRCQLVILKVGTEEPFLFIRPHLMGIASDNLEQQTNSLIKLRTLISAEKYHPPGVSHAIFGNLLGLLRWAHEKAHPQGLYMQAALLPLLGDVVLSMNGLKYSDFKKERLDVFLTTNGSFWFPQRKPDQKSKKQVELPEDMFPTKLNPERSALQISPTFDDTDGSIAQLFCVYVLRINQVKFMTNFIRKHPYEVSSIKDSILDGTIGDRILERTFRPEMFKANPKYEGTFEMLESWRMRSWLELFDVVFQNFSGAYNFKEKNLELFIQTIDMALINFPHHHDVVRQALSVYITLVTRFQGFFSRKGYSNFLQLLFTTYRKNLASEAIKSGIQYAFQRFYNLHGEAFLLQALQSLVPRIVEGEADEDAIVLYQLLSCLRFPIERDLLSISGVSLPSISKPETPFDLTFFIKLLLTVVGRELGLPLSVTYLKTFRLMIPFFFRDLEDTVFLDQTVGVLIKNLFGKKLDAKSGLANGVTSLNRALGRKTEPKHAGELREELLRFLTVYYKHGGTLSGEHHLLVAKSVRALFKSKLRKDDEVATDFSWLFQYISDGVLSIVEQEESFLACSILTEKLAKIFKKHWRSFGDSFDDHRVSLFDCLKLMIMKFPSPQLHKDFRTHFLVDGINLMLEKNTRTQPHHQKVQFSLVQFLVSLLECTEANIISDLLSFPPTPEFFDGIFIPLVLELGKASFVNYRNYEDYWSKLASYCEDACRSSSKRHDESQPLAFLALKTVLVSGECFRNSPSKWFSLSTFVKDSVEDQVGSHPGARMHKLTLLKFVSTYRTPLTIYLRTYVGYLIRRLETQVPQDAANQEELTEIMAAVKAGKSVSRQVILEDFQKEWSRIRSNSSEVN